MLEKDVLTSIFKLIFIDGSSLRKASTALNINRSTISKYVRIMEKNLSNLKSELILNNQCLEGNLDEFIITNLDDYIDKIISFTHTRSKRVLKDDIVDDISKLAEYLNTKSATIIFDFIYENLRDTSLYNLSLSSIWRALKQSYKK